MIRARVSDLFWLQGFDCTLTVCTVNLIRQCTLSTVKSKDLHVTYGVDVSNAMSVVPYSIPHASFYNIPFQYLLFQVIFEVENYIVLC